MKLLCLYNNPCALELFHWLNSQGHETVIWSEKIDRDWCEDQKFDLAISYTYRYILSEDILDALHNNAVNIHTSYLPWNRGADPNIWSILEETPRGVTLHYMNSELDKGDIIAQQLIADDVESETLSSSYQMLDQVAKQLFKDAFCFYEYWTFMRKKSCGPGSYHSVSDAKEIKDLILTYDMSVLEFKEIVQKEDRN